MTRSEFNKKIVATVGEAREQLAELLEKKNALKAREKDFSAQYVREKLHPQIEMLEESMNRVRSEAQRAVNKIVDAYAEDLAGADDLNPADLTDDLRLLNCGVVLGERDLRAMLARNDGNRTMTQLILRYANQNGVTVKGVRYVSAAYEEGMVRKLAGESARVALERPDNTAAFAALFGPASQFYTE